MPTPPALLNGHFHWAQVLPILGVSTQLSGLPNRQQCPLCRQHALSVHQDSTAGGEWHYCFDCKFAGDSIELAAKVLRATIPHALQHLVKEGAGSPFSDPLPSLLERYQRNVVKPRHAAQTFWQRAQAALARDMPMLSLLRVLRGYRELSPERWAAGPAQYVGSAAREAVEALYGNPSTRVLKGSGWTRVLVLPHYDLPGRLCGFTFIGRNGNPEDIVYRAIKPPSGKLQAGLCGLDAALSSSWSPWKGLLVAVNDPLLLLRLQCQHLANSLYPLPLVAWLDTPEGQTSEMTWAAVSHHQNILWDSKFSPELIHQAMRSQAKLSFLAQREEPGPRGQVSYYKERPENLFKRLPDLTIEVSKKLAQALRDLPDVEALPLAETIQQYPQLLAGVKPHASRRLQALLNRVPQVQAVYAEGYQVRRQGDQWTVLKHGKPELLCDANLTITKVISQKRTGRVFYRGWIGFKGEQYRFCEPVESIDPNPFLWMRNRLIQADAGVMRFNPRWSQVAVTIAQQFCVPQLVQSEDYMGWDPEAQKWHFPHFWIDDLGRTGPAVAEYAGPVPGPTFKEPPVLTREDLAELGSLPAAWGLVGLVLSNLLAPWAGQRTRGIVVSWGQPEASGVENLARHIGCISQTVQSRPVCVYNAEERWQGWPVWTVLSRKAGRPGSREWLEYSESDRNALVELNGLQSLAMLARGWVAVYPDAPLPATFSPAWKKVIPAFLRSRAALNLPGIAESWPVWVFSELAAFLDEIEAGRGNVVLEGLLAVRRENAAAFVDLICLIYRNGALQLRPASFAEPDKDLVFDSSRILVSRPLLESLAERYDLPQFDLEKLSEAAKTQKWLGRPWEEIPGICIEIEAWRRTLAAVGESDGRAAAG